MVERRLVIARQFGLCKCGCGKTVYASRGLGTHFDHEPALRLRAVNAEGTDYDPPQHSVAHLDAYANLSHAKRKTSGSGATTAGTDIGKIKKERKRSRLKRDGKKLRGRPMGKGRGFPPRGSRPMRSKKT